MNLDTQKEAATKVAKDAADVTVEYATKAKDMSVSTAKSVADSASEYLEKMMELGGSATDTATDTAKNVFEKAQSLTGKGIEKVSEVQVGEKNVGEVAQATVETVQEKIDVDQIQDQVAKLRDQMEHVLVSWKDSFRPSTTAVEEVAEAPKAKKAPATSRKQLTAMTKDELLAIARKRDLAGRSSMTKSELVKALS
ncbi:MAG: Rho termination factor N-terminal domain-containing protein [Actinomycetota bacterium]